MDPLGVGRGGPAAFHRLMAACPRPLRGCKHNPPFASDHHRYWPKDNYTTPLEKKFRLLECNIERGLCRCLHDLEHLKRPPRKPSVAFMRRAVERK